MLRLLWDHWIVTNGFREIAAIGERDGPATAERDRAYPETYASYIKLAEAYEQAAKEREAKLAEPGSTQ
jgi:hypothetical protein